MTRVKRKTLSILLVICMAISLFPVSVFADGDLGDQTGCSHEYIAEVTSAACETGGYTTYTCQYCGDSYVDNYTDPLGHNLVDGFCTGCNKPTSGFASPDAASEDSAGPDSVSEDPADGDAVSEDPADPDAVSEDSADPGAVSEDPAGGTENQTHEHTWDEGTVTAAATCAEDGLMTYTCTMEGCDGTYTEVIPATGAHTYEDGFCTVCGEPTPGFVSPDADSGDSAGPDAVSENPADSDAVSEDPAGPDADSGESAGPDVGSEDSAGGAEDQTHEHTWDKGAVTVAATCAEDGVMTYACTAEGCDGTYTEIIPATGKHTYEDGFCTVCGEQDPDFVSPDDTDIVSEDISSEETVSEEKAGNAAGTDAAGSSMKNAEGSEISGTLRVGNALVTEAGTVENTGASGTAEVTVEEDSIILTLNNFSFTGSGDVQGADYAPIWYKGDYNLIINLSGTNTLINDVSGLAADLCGYGVYYDGYSNDNNLTITGSGSLDVGFANVQDTYPKLDGVFVANGSLILNGTGTVSSSGGAGNESIGIYSSGKVTVEGGNILAKGINNGIYESRGIKSDSGLIINQGNVTAYASSSDSSSSYKGAHGVEGKVTLNDGTLTATGILNSEKGEGVFGSVTFKGGSMVAYGSFKCIDFGRLTVGNDVNVTVMGSHAADGSNGVEITDLNDVGNYEYVSVTTGSTPAPSQHVHTDGLIFTAWTSTSSLPVSAGSYYLVNDVTLNGTWSVPAGTVNFCLNGKTITADTDNAAVNIPSGAVLNLYDCDGSGEICHSSGKSGAGADVSGTFNMFDGTISDNAEGVHVNSSGVFNVCGKVSITGNNSNDSPCNVFLESGKAIGITGSLDGAQIGVTMQGGTGVFTSGAGFASNAAAQEVFKSDHYGCFVNVAEGEAELVSHTAGLYVGNAEVGLAGTLLTPEETGATGNASVDYDDENDEIVLTLSNFSYSGGGYTNGYDSAVIWYRGAKNLKISLVGSNTLINDGSGIDANGCAYGIYYSSYGDLNYDYQVLTIEGDGSLDISFASVGNTYWKLDGIFAEPGTVVLNGTGTVNAAGGEGKESIGIFANRTVTINSGTVNATGAKTSAYESRGIASSSVVINGGTVTAFAFSDDYAAYGIDGKLSLTGGVLTAKGISHSSDPYKKGKGVSNWVTVSGGSMIAYGSSQGIESLEEDNNTSLTVMGGQAENGSDATEIESPYSNMSSYKYVSVGTGDSHIHEGLMFTKWTDSSSLPSAEGNYCLEGDVTLSETWSVPSGTVNFCLNGKTITADTDNAAVNIPSGAVLNLYDCDGSGVITHSSGKSGAGADVSGTFNMFGGTISNNEEGVHINSSGVFNVSGKVSITGNSSNGSPCNVFLESGEAIGVAGSLEGAQIGVTMQGGAGVFTSGAGFANNAAAQAVFSSDIATYIIAMDSSSGEAALAAPTAKIGETYYAALAEAIAAVPKNNTLTTITLLKDTEERVKIDEKQNIKLELNGKKISMNTGSNPVITNYGKLAIDGTADGSGIETSSSICAISNFDAILTVNGGTYESTCAEYPGWENGLFEFSFVNSSEKSVISNVTAISRFTIFYSGSRSKMYIQDCYVPETEKDPNYNCPVFYTSNTACQIEIDGGTYYATYNGNGNIFYGGEGFINVINGDFTQGGTDAMAKGVNSPTFTFEGGRFNGKGALVSGSRNTVSISGGKYSASLGADIEEHEDDYLNEGYSLVANFGPDKEIYPKEVRSVSGDDIFQVDDKIFDSFNAAFNEAKTLSAVMSDPVEIHMLQDYYTSSSYTFDAQADGILLDLNGCTYTYTGNNVARAAFVVDGGKLFIADNGTGGSLTASDGNGILVRTGTFTQNGGSITGNIKISASGRVETDGLSVMLAAGTMDGNIVIDDDETTAIAIASGKAVIKKANTVTLAPPDGFRWKDNGDGTSTLVTAYAAFSYNLVLQDSIKIVYYVKNLTEDPSEYTITYNYKNVTTEPITLTDRTLNSFVVAACAAKEMTEPVTITVRHNDTVIKQRVLTVRDYCDTAFEKSGSDEKLIALCEATLDYGRYAQDEFEYRTDDLANRGNDYNDVQNVDIPEAESTKSGECTGITGRSFNLLTQAETQFNIYLKHDRNAEIENYTFQVDNDVLTEQPVDASGKYQIIIPGIAAKNLGDSHTVVVTNKTDSSSHTYTVSPLVYMYKARDYNITKALYNYYLAAKEYMNPR